MIIAKPFLDHGSRNAKILIVEDIFIGDPSSIMFLLKSLKCIHHPNKIQFTNEENEEPEMDSNIIDLKLL